MEGENHPIPVFNLTFQPFGVDKTWRHILKGEVKNRIRGKTPFLTSPFILFPVGVPLYGQAV